MIGDLPEADSKPPTNMLFVCKLNQVQPPASRPAPRRGPDFCHCRSVCNKPSVQDLLAPSLAFFSLTPPWGPVPFLLCPLWD